MIIHRNANCVLHTVSVLCVLFKVTNLWRKNRINGQQFIRVSFPSWVLLCFQWLCWPHDWHSNQQLGSMADCLQEAEIFFNCQPVNHVFVFFHCVVIVFCWVSEYLIKLWLWWEEPCSSAMSVECYLAVCPSRGYHQGMKSWEPDWEQHQYHWMLIDRAVCEMWMLLEKQYRVYLLPNTHLDV